MARESASDKMKAFYAGLPEHIRNGQGQKKYSAFEIVSKAVGGIGLLTPLTSAIGGMKLAITRAKFNADVLRAKQEEYDSAKAAYEYTRTRTGPKEEQLKRDEKRFAAAGKALSSAKDMKTAKAMGAASFIGKGLASGVKKTMSGFSFAVSGIAMTTGNSSLQERAMRQQELLDEKMAYAQGFVSGAVSGAIAGSVLGPIGIVGGFIIGAVGGVLSAEEERQRKYEERRREYEYSAFKLDTARSIAQYRSGVTVTNGRLHQY